LSGFLDDASQSAERRETKVTETDITSLKGEEFFEKGLPEAPKSEEEVFSGEDKKVDLEIPARRLKGRRSGRKAPKRQGTREGGARFLWVLIAAAAAATLGLSIRFTKLADIHWGFWFLLVLFVITQQFRLKLRGGGDIKLGYASLIIALIASGLGYAKRSALKPPMAPVWVVWIFFLGSAAEIIVHVIEGRMTRDEATRIAIDFSGVGLGVLLFHGIVDLMPKAPEFNGGYWPGLFIGAGLAALIMYLFQLIGTALCLSQEGYLPTGVYLSSLTRRSWIPFIAVVISGFFGGLLYIGVGKWSSLFALLLLFILYYAYNRLAETDTYLLETVRALATIPEKTGVLPEGHTSRVAWLAGATARELGISPEDVSQVEYAAYLHEVGTLTDKKTDEHEPGEIPSGHAASARVLSRVDYLSTACEILKGREGVADRITDPAKRKVVSTGAGILRAVEDFDSLITGGEARELMSPSQAMTEMNLERGTKYESKVLRAMSRVISRLREEGVEWIDKGDWKSSPPGGEQET